MARTRLRAEHPRSLINCTVRPVTIPEEIAGVDVGEDFLDLAVLHANAIAHHRIPLLGIEANPIETLRGRLLACCPAAGPRWLVLIDSPRWPRDLDCSSSSVAARDPIPASRALDRALREMLRASPEHGAMRLSMFPTPALAYFRQCAAVPACKPHLRSIYRQLFEPEPNPPAPSEPIESAAAVPGGTFTRFMLTGFLTFRAWNALGVQNLEAYPELEYRLSGRGPIASKRQGMEAVRTTRIESIERLRRTLDIGAGPMPSSLDQADAEILALSAMSAAKRGCLAALENPAEGRFLITF